MTGIEVVPQSLGVAISLVCALTDALKGKIYNAIILGGLVAGILWLMFVGVFNGIGGHAEYAKEGFEELGVLSFESAPRSDEEGSQDDAPSFFAYTVRVLANFALAVVAGFALWWFGLWAAGDAKLFMVLALLLPLSTYHKAFFPVFPSYVLLFNTFAFALLGLAVEFIFRFVRQLIKPTEHEKTAMKEALSWIKAHKGEMVLGFFAIFFIFVAIKTLRMVARDAISNMLDIKAKPVVYFLLFLFFHPVTNLMRRKTVLIAVVGLSALFVLFVLLFPSEGLNIRTVLSMTGFALGIVLFYMTYSLFLNIFDFKAISVWELKPRMILARKTIEVLKEDMDLLNKKMGEIGADGLTSEQVEVLRRWWIDRGKGEEIFVARTIPFAPALFLGALFTVVTGDYVLWV
jgi:preflagellin peptidase FlaK